MSDTPIDISFLASLSGTRHDQMVSIIKLSTQMLDSARSEDWENLTKSESERNTLMRQFFAEAATVDTAAATEQSIRLILSLDKKILALTEKTRDSLGAEIHQLMAGQKAKKAYLQNSR